MGEKGTTVGFLSGAGGAHTPLACPWHYKVIGEQKNAAVELQTWIFSARG